MKPALSIAKSHAPPERSPSPPQRITREPVRLQPIRWGTPDRDLARCVCWHIVDTTPPTVIPFNPRKHARMKRHLAHFLHY